MHIICPIVHGLCHDWLPLRGLPYGAVGPRGKEVLRGGRPKMRSKSAAPGPAMRQPESAGRRRRRGRSPRARTMARQENPCNTKVDSPSISGAWPEGEGSAEARPTGPSMAHRRRAAGPLRRSRRSKLLDSVARFCACRENRPSPAYCLAAWALVVALVWRATWCGCWPQTAGFYDCRP